jgi:hypothetical protein
MRRIQSRRRWKGNGGVERLNEHRAGINKEIATGKFDVRNTEKRNRKSASDEN